MKNVHARGERDAVPRAGKKLDARQAAPHRVVAVTKASLQRQMSTKPVNEEAER